MAWKTPKIVEVSVGMEINMYIGPACAGWPAQDHLSRVRFPNDAERSRLDRMCRLRQGNGRRRQHGNAARDSASQGSPMSWQPPLSWVEIIEILSHQFRYCAVGARLL